MSEKERIIIGNYRIRYNGVPVIVPVDMDGFLLLPDGKTVALGKDQVEILRQDYERRKKEEANAVMLTVPADEGAKKAADNGAAAESGPATQPADEGKILDNKTVPSGDNSQSTNTNPPLQNDKKRKGNSETILAVLISVFATLLIVTGGFLYLVGRGFVTVNRPMNGFVIYDDARDNSANGVSYSISDTKLLCAVAEEV